MPTGGEVIVGGGLGLLVSKLLGGPRRNLSPNLEDTRSGLSSVVFSEMRGGVVDALMHSVYMTPVGPKAFRAHDVHPGLATHIAPASQPPSSAAGGLGGQTGIGVMGPVYPTVPAASAPERWVLQQEYNQQQQAHAQVAQLFDTESFPMFWRNQQYLAFQDADPELAEDTGTFATASLNAGPIPQRIARLNKSYVSAWQGIQQWGYTQTNMRLNMRPVGPWRDKTRGTRSVSGLANVQVQGSGTMRIPAVFVPTSVY